MMLQAPPWPDPPATPGPGQARAVRVRDAAEGAAALRLGAQAGLRGALPLISAPGAALALGAQAFLAMMVRAEALASRSVLRPLPVLDCADAPGLALAALRAGVPAVVLRPEVPGFAALASVAAELGLVIWPAPPPCAGPFDPGDTRAQAALAAWLAPGDSSAPLG